MADATKADIFERMNAHLGDAFERTQRMHAGLRYAFAHLEEWREAYPNHWVAVREDRLVAAESSWKHLVEAVERNGVSLGDCYVRFLPEDVRDYLL